MQTIPAPDNLHVHLDILVAWDCPNCKKENKFYGYMHTGVKQFSCKFCGERVQGSINLPQL